MYKARYYKTDGTEAGDRELPVWLFDGIVNENVLHQAVRAYLLNQRQGTASAKTRGEVRGGSRKPWRQKGTGRARQGTIRSPIWEGGGIAFPPKPKSWRVDLPKKVKHLAHRSALNARAGSGGVLLVDELDFEAPKTKRLRETLEALGCDGKVLLLTHGVKEAVHLSGRNLPEVKVLPFGEESAYDVLWASTIVIERPALDTATEEAEAAGLVQKAERRIARAEEKAKAAEAEAPSKKAKAAAKKKEAAPKAEAAPKKKAAPKKEAKAEKEAKPKKSAEPAAEKKAPAPDVSEIELPTVKELAEFLAGFDDVATLRALQERDSRKTAQPHYEHRIQELTGQEDDNG